MSETKNYLVFVEACDYFDVEAENEDQAKIEAVEVFKSNPHDAAYQTSVMRESDNGEDTFPVKEVASA